MADDKQCDISYEIIFRLCVYAAMQSVDGDVLTEIVCNFNHPRIHYDNESVIPRNRLIFR